MIREKEDFKITNFTKGMPIILKKNIVFSLKNVYIFFIILINLYILGHNL